MATTYSTVLTIGLVVLSGGILAQTDGCNANVVLRLFVPGLDDGGGRGADDGPGDDRGGSGEIEPGHGGQGGDDGAAGSPSQQDPSGAAGGNSGGNGGGNADEIRLFASLRGAAAIKGKAEFRDRGSRLRLKVQLENAVPGGTHVIGVDGTEIGMLTIDALGRAEIEFDTNIEPGHAPWPNELTGRIVPGTSIRVGELSGVFG